MVDCDAKFITRKDLIEYIEMHHIPCRYHNYIKDDIKRHLVLKFL